MDTLTPEDEAFLKATVPDPKRRARLRVQLAVAIELKGGLLTNAQAMERLRAAGLSEQEAALALADATGGLRE